MILFNIILIVLFAVIFNWSVNMQILAISEKTKKEKTIAIVVSFLLALLLGIIVSIN
jgi:hypothetical protein